MNRTRIAVVLGFIVIPVVLALILAHFSNQSLAESKERQARAALVAAQNWTAPSDSARIMSNRLTGNEHILVQAGAATHDELEAEHDRLHRLYISWRFTSSNPNTIRDAMKSCKLFGFRPQNVIALHPEGSVKHVRTVLNDRIDEFIGQQAQRQDPDWCADEIAEHSAMVRGLDANASNYYMVPTRYEEPSHTPAPGGATLGEM